MLNFLLQKKREAQPVKGLPAVQETWVRFLGWEDPLEKEMTIHSSILAWKIPWMEEPGGLGRKESDTTKQTHARTRTHTHTRTHMNMEDHMW